MVTSCGWGWRDKQKDILQKESPGRVLQEMCSKIFSKTYRKTRVQEPLLKRVPGCKPATLIEKRLMRKFFSMISFKLFRTAFLKYTREVCNRYFWRTYITPIHTKNNHIKKHTHKIQTFSIILIYTKK